MERLQLLIDILTHREPTEKERTEIRGILEQVLDSYDEEEGTDMTLYADILFFSLMLVVFSIGFFLGSLIF